MKMSNLQKAGSIVMLGGYNRELRQSIAQRTPNEEQKAKADEEARKRLEERR